MTYIDGFVLPVKVKNLAAYKKMAKDASKVWMKHGALQYVEAAGDDLTPNITDFKCMTFPQISGAKKGETVLFSFIVYKSRAHRDKVNKLVMAEMEKKYDKKMKMPFNPKMMAYGGFKAIVEE